MVRPLNVLKRIGQHLNKLAKITIYHSFIMSNLSYCPLTWHFCTERNTNKIENAGKSITFHLWRQHQLIWHTAWTIKTTIIKNQTNEKHGIREYKIVNKSSPEFLHNHTTLKINSYNFRYKLTVELQRPRTTRYGKKSFSYEAAKLWNSLPNHARSLSTFHSVGTEVYSKQATSIFVMVYSDDPSLAGL